MVTDSVVVENWGGWENPDDSSCHELVFLRHAMVAGMTFDLLIVSA